MYINQLGRNGGLFGISAAQLGMAAGGAQAAT